MEPRADSYVRCAYCHAPALEDEDDAARTCHGCRTVLHADCLATNGGCPTLGCPRAPREPREVTAAPEEAVGTRAPGVALLVTLAGIALSVVATGALSAIGLLCATAGVLVLVWFIPWARPSGHAPVLPRLTEAPPLLGPLAEGPPVAATTVTRITDLDAAVARPDAWLECDDPGAVIEEARWALRGSPSAAGRLRGPRAGPRARGRGAAARPRPTGRPVAVRGPGAPPPAHRKRRARPGGRRPLRRTRHVGAAGATPHARRAPLDHASAYASSTACSGSPPRCGVTWSSPGRTQRRCARSATTARTCATGRSCWRGDRRDVGAMTRFPGV